MGLARITSLHQLMRLVGSMGLFGLTLFFIVGNGGHEGRPSLHEGSYEGVSDCSGQSATAEVNFSGIVGYELQSCFETESQASCVEKAKKYCTDLRSCMGNIDWVAADAAGVDPEATCYTLFSGFVSEIVKLRSGNGQGRVDVDLDTEDIKEVYSLRLWLEVHERYFCDLDLDVALAQNDYGFMHDLGIDFALITREGGSDILHGEVGGLPIRCPMVRYEDLNVALFDCRDATTGEAVCTVTLRNTEYH